MYFKAITYNIDRLSPGQLTHELILNIQFNRSETCIAPGIYKHIYFF